MRINLVIIWRADIMRMNVSSDKDKKFCIIVFQNKGILSFNYN